MMAEKKIKLFDILIDALTMQETVQKIAQWVDEKEFKSRYVVTPNVDHIVNLTRNQQFKLAYDHASLVVADGRPVVLASKLLGRSLPDVVPGSDMVPAIFDYYESQPKKPLKVFLLGAMPGVAVRAASNISLHWPSVNVVGCYSPDVGFEKSIQDSKRICDIVNKCMPDIVVFGVGAPKQEIWCNQYANQLNTNVILCVGACLLSHDG